ncbi:MAG: ATP-NAD kinase family protein [Candidatus Korarchaeota archaeon]|nr:ATP-NAD kinase family protein [Candidatus Korarchaeota archaeon]
MRLWVSNIYKKRRKIGLIVNPIAGLGGPLGRKGTDDHKTVAEALRRGLKKTSLERATRALKFFRGIDVVVYAPRGEMGEISVISAGLGSKFIPLEYTPSSPSTREDTLRASEEIVRKGVDLLLFSGGDGTAADVLKVVNHRLVVLGIPSGVKVFSSVFAKTPEDAGRVARDYLEGRLDEAVGEVVDIPEEDYRSGSFSPKVIGTLRVPCSHLVQGSKSMEAPDEVVLEGIYRYIRSRLEARGLIVLGPGRTVSFIAAKMGYEKNPSTVDVITGGKYLEDVDYFEMESIIGGSQDRPLVILTPIGGTSFLLGRGNHQLIPAIKRADWGEDVMIVSTPSKIRNIEELLVDVDEPLENVPGYIRVIIGYREEKIVRVRLTQ